VLTGRASQRITSAGEARKAAYEKEIAQCWADLAKYRNVNTASPK
jgi:hypothetical protein